MKAYSQHHELVRKCLKGNRTAQYELYSLYSQGMYSICLRMLNNPMDAEDVLQNSFIDIFQKLNTFQFNSTIGAWIKRIVVNNCINFLKSKKRFVFEEFLLEEKPEEHNSAVKIDFTVDKIKTAMAALPEGYRAIFTLHAFEGYDHQEIGAIMSISPSTSKSQYSRAKQKIRKILVDA